MSHQKKEGVELTKETNRDNRRNTRELNHKIRGKNQHSIRDKSISFTGENEGLKNFMYPTEIRDKVQYIEFKEYTNYTIVHAHTNFKHPQTF